MDEMQTLNLKVSECERLKKTVDRHNAEEIQEYIDWVLRERIPFEKTYDV